MTILVTGGAGYIGSHMVLSLLEAGEEVIVLDRLSTGFERSIAPGVKLYRGDIGDVEVLDTVFASYEIEAIFHFAGSVVVPESVSNPLEYYSNNTVKSRVLIEHAIRNEVSHFIFSSTAAVYGTPKTSAPVAESADLKPESPYGSSKLMTEVMLRDAALAHPGFKYTILRYFNVAGSDPLGRIGQSTLGATHLIKVACEAATGKRQALKVFGSDYATPDGTCVRDYIHVSDLTQAHLDALARLRRGGNSIIANCGYGLGFSVMEVINCVKKLSGVDFEVDVTGRRPGDAASVIANTDLAATELGWKPRYGDLGVIVQTALDWEKKLGSAAWMRAL